MEHIYQEGNGVADELANLGHSVTRLTECDEISLIPSSTKLLIKHESTSNTII